MKKQILLLVFLSFCFLLGISAQSKFGNATKDELEMVSYQKDTTASAVMLHKEGEVRFVYSELRGFEFEYTYQFKFKILKPEGLSYADNEIMYYEASAQSKEEIRGLSGTTYNLEDGKIIKTKLGKENIFEEDTGEKWKRRKFTMPAAKVGSVVEYKYTITSGFYYELREFSFQASIPIEYVKFQATIPEYLNYNLDTQGYIRFDESTTMPVNDQFDMKYRDGNGHLQTGIQRFTSNRYTFKASNVPAAKNEPNLWTINDYISKVSFELRSTNFPGSFYKPVASSWDNVDKEFLDSNIFGGNLKRAGWFKDEIEKGDLTMERACQIKRLIKNKVQWNQKGGILTSKLKDALDKGIGSSADMNFLLINALKAGGFDVYAVILSTRGHGRIPITHPSRSAFNYVITGVSIDDKMYYTDASSKFSGWNILPEKCMVESARILSENYKAWVDISKISSGAVLKQIDVSFEDDNVITKLAETRYGNDAYHQRDAYSKFENEEKFLEHRENANSLSIEDFVMTGYDNNNGALKQEMVEKKNIDLDANILYYTPPLSKVFPDNPFKAETRTFPINFDYIRSYVQLVKIKIPVNYEVEELPKAERILLNDNDMLYIYNVVAEAEEITLNVRFQLKNLTFLPADYDAVKDFIGKMNQKMLEQIVFKKITTKETIVENEEASM